MHYNQRLKVAAILSLTIHLLMLYLFSNINHDKQPADIWRDDPIVLNLQPESEMYSRSLVDPSIQTTPPDETNNIAEFDARAADLVLQNGEHEGPLVLEEAEHEMTALPGLPPAPPPTAIPQDIPTVELSQPSAEPIHEPTQDASPAPEIDVAPEPVEIPQESAPVREESPVMSTPPPAVVPETTPPAPMPDPASVPVQEPESETTVEQTESVTLPDSFQVAQAAPMPELPQPGHSRGRLDNAVRNEGFTNFDAIQDELAPYLREIRRQVERRWNEALLTRYSGTSPTVATVDCAIATDGTLVFVEIIGEPRDRVYASLCRDAIQRAAPFKPFPFEVPDIYRGQNLEIRWTFNFL